jgi:hypothetical protein
MRSSPITISVLICLISLATRAQEPASGKIALKISIETVESAPNLPDAPIRLVFEKPIKSKSNEPIPGELAKLKEGDNSIDVSNFPDGKFHIFLHRKGCAPQWIRVTIENGEATVNRSDITLYRTRYAIIHYAWNKKNGRELTGADVETGRVAVAHWGAFMPFHQDWQIWQSDSGRAATFGTTVSLDFHRIDNDYGFSDAPAGSTFDDLTEAPAPAPEKYRCISREARAGTLLFCRVQGTARDGDQLGYGKIEVEDITFTPPKGMKVFERE